MAAFSSLTERLSGAFKHLRRKGKLSDADIDGTIREIRRALLDADVALDVVLLFIMFTLLLLKTNATMTLVRNLRLQRRRRLKSRESRLRVQNP